MKRLTTIVFDSALMFASSLSFQGGAGASAKVSYFDETMHHSPSVTRNALFWLFGLLLVVFMGLAASVARADTVLTPPIAVSNSPQRLTVTPDGKAVYVVNSGSSWMSMIDADPTSPTFNTLTDTIDVVSIAATDVAISPSGYAYVTMQGRRVQVIDTNPARPTYNTIIKTIDIPITWRDDWPGEVAITPDGKRAYVTNHTGHTVIVIDTDPASPTFNTIIDTITDANGLSASADPWGIAIAPNGLAYVSDYSASAVYVIDTNPASAAYNTVVRSYTDPNVGHGSAQVAVTPNGRYVYVGHWFPNSVTLIDTVANTVNTIDIGSASVGLAVTADGNYVYVTANSTNSVIVIDTGSNTVIDTLAVGAGPYGVTINGCYVYATNLTDRTVSVIERSGNCSGGSGGGGGGGGGSGSGSSSTTPVPALNPAALALLVLALGGVVAATRRRAR